MVCGIQLWDCTKVLLCEDRFELATQDISFLQIVAVVTLDVRGSTPIASHCLDLMKEYGFFVFPICLSDTRLLHSL